MAEKFFELDHVTHVYQSGEGEGHEALRGVTLSIGAGEFVAVLGANGSGKSTLARHLNALLFPSEGHCYVRGMDTRDEALRWDIRQEVSMVFQNPDNQLIAAVVADDVAFGPENLGVPPAEIRRRVADALALVGMERYTQAAPHLLSGGQKQRIAIAGAIAMQTHALVLDEPTAMLDPRGRAEVLSAVERLHEEQGMTIVYITHFMEEAIAADRIVLMDAGQVVMDGTPREIFSQPEKVRALGLDVPLAADIAERLRRGGRDLPQDIVTDEELLHCLSR
ncbi:energy-coupling factor transporter ATPase [Selenomonas sp. oral taxon 138]|uniref:energy-coupling factor transporter ATPase n=1 Tax=Selenomonas sp. oral taxon 138 TaxID=712532 RepID=UPI0002A20601|nr:energy-coupling factor transporter ATPase [Selenomonas sp. oral taxon 138]EKX98560.1 cobalt ABC transporter, ATP-binding protein [Selenomonas sp. oral taxon 138 str. F0429]